MLSLKKRVRKKVEAQWYYFDSDIKLKRSTLLASINVVLPFSQSGIFYSNEPRVRCEVTAQQDTSQLITGGWAHSGFGFTQVTNHSMRRGSGIEFSLSARRHCARTRLR